MKRIALALMLALIPTFALAQAPEVEIQAWTVVPSAGEIGVYMDPATPCNIMWVELNGFAFFLKGDGLPNPDNWNLSQATGANSSWAALFSFTDTFAEGRAFTVYVPGCETLTLTTNSYVQRWPNGWLQDRPILEGSIVGGCYKAAQGSDTWSKIKGLYK